MAGSPIYKIYRNKEYLASVKYLEDAVMIAEGLFAEIRRGHSRVIWACPEPGKGVLNSYEEEAEKIREKINLCVPVVRVTDRWATSWVLNDFPVRTVNWFGNRMRMLSPPFAPPVL